MELEQDAVEERDGDEEMLEELLGDDVQGPDVKKAKQELCLVHVIQECMCTCTRSGAWPYQVSHMRCN